MKKIVFLMIFSLFGCANSKIKNEPKYFVESKNYSVLCEKAPKKYKNKLALEKQYVSYNACISSVEYKFKVDENQKKKLADNIGMYYVTIVPSLGWATCEVVYQKTQREDTVFYENYEICINSEEYKKYEDNDAN